MLIFTPHEPVQIKTVVFDFDGTLSTLRHGWELVMAPLMEECISGGNATDEIKMLVAAYIDESTGIQTIHQMKWLAETVRKYGITPHDPWFYKDEYNRRLMRQVARRRENVLSGETPASEFLMAGSVEFLQSLRQRGVTMYAASGTDDEDVRAEASALGLSAYFTRIDGAKSRSEGCSKEETLRRLIAEGGDPASLLVVGDGKVEIMLGREYGALTLGVASDEAKRSGLNEEKTRSLTAAGAHAIIGDFICGEEILAWAGIL